MLPRMRDEVLGLIKFFANKSSIFFFNSLNLRGDILNGDMDMALVPSNKSVEKTNIFFWG